MKSKLWMLAALLSVGCIVVVEEPQTVQKVVVREAPPAAVVEVRTTAPAQNYVWIDGYWSWNNNSGWVWIAGHWEVSRPGYVWVVPHYETRNGQHYYASGGWTKSDGYKGKGSNNKKGYSTGQPQKCPQGYAWIEGVCKKSDKTNYK